LSLQQYGRQGGVAEFNGECITSDACALLLRKVNERLGVVFAVRTWQ
jgi:hypothetical protein